MGKKKNKKSFYKNQLKPLLDGNRVLIAGITGVAAGIAIANILGTEKAKEIVGTVEDSVRDFTSKVKSEVSKNSYKNQEDVATKKPASAT